ncbi:Probable 2-dehydropantoate 2-reductase [Mycobacteroides abscessus]|nr:Probable 2-dehydropantoate 2-reductase [Mycobacteroides abscessus]
MRIAVAGAGSIGCYVGGRLQAAEHQVVYIGRPSLGRAIAEHGLRLSDYLGWSAAIPASECAFSEDIDTVRSADIVLVTVKSAATAQMAESLAGRLRPGAVVVSLQNGIRNPAQLSRYIKQHNVITGMVGFNVAQVGAAHFHQGTQGKLSLSTGADSLAGALTHGGLPTTVRDDMAAVQWGKLVVNLNNSVNALSGLPLKAELGDRDYRLVLAAAQREALDSCAVPASQWSALLRHRFRSCPGCSRCLTPSLPGPRDRWLRWTHTHAHPCLTTSPSADRPKSTTSTAKSSNLPKGSAPTHPLTPRWSVSSATSLPPTR